MAADGARPRLSFHRRSTVDRPATKAAVLDDYTKALQSAPLSDQTRRTYASKVRQFLALLASAGLDSDPLTSADGRDWAVRDYRTHLQAVLKRSPATVNNALAAVDDFYIRHGLGPANAARVEIPAAAPRALDKRAQLRYLRAVQACPSPRDQALALVPFYAGARISEIVALDVDDIARSARKGVLRICGKGERVRKSGSHYTFSALAARGAEHHQILDSFEGVHAAESTVATQLSEITGQVADSKDNAGYAATAARLRVAASVFGN